MDDNDIIHVAGIVLQPETLLTESVQTVQIDQRKPLARLISKRQPPSGRRFITVDNQLAKLIDKLILDHLS